MAYARSSEINVDHPWLTPAEPADPVLRRIGLWLRDARIQRGLDLHDVAEELRIKPAYLRALEDGNLAPIPGRPYALGFLRTYAVFLGLDGDELVRRVKADERGETAHPELSVRMPMVESRVPKLRLLVASLFLVAGIYGGWSYVNEDLRPPDKTVEAVPTELREPTPRGLPPVPAAPRDAGPAFAAEERSPRPMAERNAADRPAVATPASERVAAPPAAEAPSAATDAEETTAPRAVPATEAALGATDGSERAAAARTADLALPAEVRGVGPRDGARTESGPSAAELLARLAAARPGDGARDVRVYGRAHGDSRVRLEAVDTSWIQVRSADNTFTYTRTLQPGDVYVVPSRTDLGLWTGNAGGLRVIVDGRSLPPLGRPHEVRRDVPLDPEKLLARAENTSGAAVDGRR